MPLLLAEGDRDTYRRQQAALAREREIMKDVKGWEVSVVLSLCIFSDINIVIVYHVEKYRGAESIVVL